MGRDLGGGGEDIHCSALVSLGGKMTFSNYCWADPVHSKAKHQGLSFSKLPHQKHMPGLSFSQMKMKVSGLIRK